MFLPNVCLWSSRDADGWFAHEWITGFACLQQWALLLHFCTNKSWRCMRWRCSLGRVKPSVRGLQQEKWLWGNIRFDWAEVYHHDASRRISILSCSDVCESVSMWRSSDLIQINNCVNTSYAVPWIYSSMQTSQNHSALTNILHLLHI